MRRCIGRSRAAETTQAKVCGQGTGGQYPPPVLAYVTGGSGFVGGWLCGHLLAEGDQAVAPTVDIIDSAAISASIMEVAPEVIYHLAAQAHVGQSWKDPVETFRVNALGTLNVLEAARVMASPPRVVVISSAEVYGNVSEGELPIVETHPLEPVSPYGASKVSAEVLARQSFVGGRLDVIRTRAFNHIGPGQSDSFVISGVARQIARAERPGADPVVRVGNLEARRDMSDVRDVVRAYRLVALRGVAGEAYNVCSGIDHRIGALVEMMISMAARPVQVEVDPARLRPVDLPVQRGNAAKLQAHTGWSPVFRIEDSIRDVLEYWRSQAT